jgi:hypothetical protein
MIIWSRAKTRASNLFGQRGAAAIHALEDIYNQPSYYRFASATEYLLEAEKTQQPVVGVKVGYIFEAKDMKEPGSIRHSASYIFQQMRKASTSKIEVEPKHLEGYECILRQGTFGTSILVGLKKKYIKALKNVQSVLTKAQMEMLANNFAEFAALQAWYRIVPTTDPLVSGIERLYHDGWPVIAIDIAWHPPLISVAVKDIPRELRPSRN